VIVVLSLKLSSPRTQQFLTSLRSLRGKKIFQISQSKSCLHNIVQSPTIDEMYTIIRIYRGFSDINHMFCNFADFLWALWFLLSQNCFDKSQIFCQQKTFEILQSTNFLHKIIQSREINEINTDIRVYLCFSGHKVYVYVFCISYESCDFSESELFWQVSDFLPTKNIWDLAEHKLLTQNHKKSEN